MAVYFALAPPCIALISATAISIPRTASFPRTSTIKRDLGEVLLKLEEHQEREQRAAEEVEAKMVKLTEEEEQAALELLRDPELFDRIPADFDKIGVVGEKTNLLIGYVAAVSRKLDRPLGIVIPSSSAAGKSSLIVPEEDRLVYSAMTGQSLPSRRLLRPS